MAGSSLRVAQTTASTRPRAVRRHSQGLGAGRCPAGDEDPGHPSLGEPCRGQPGHVAGPDDEHAGVAQPAKLARDGCHGRTGQRPDPVAETRLVADPLPGSERRVEETVQERSRLAPLARRAIRLASLREDLVLSEHGRLQAGGHPQQMPAGLAAHPNVYVRQERSELGSGQAQPGTEQFDPAGYADTLGVELDAVTGEEPDGASGVHRARRVDDARVQTSVDRLEHLSRRTPMVEPDLEAGRRAAHSPSSEPWRLRSRSPPPR